MTNSFFYFCT